MVCDWQVFYSCMNFGWWGGFPVAVQELAMCGAMVATTMIVAPLGAVAIAANSFAITAVIADAFLYFSPALSIEIRGPYLSAEVV